MLRKKMAPKAPKYSPHYLAKINFKKLSEENKKVVRSFQSKTLSQLSTSMMEMNVDGEENRMKFKRTFILYI
ncbi:hypothetical protein AHAS_Ahas06G0098400 [Arachis hypogaea]